MAVTKAELDEAMQKVHNKAQVDMGNLDTRLLETLAKVQSELQEAIRQVNAKTDTVQGDGKVLVQNLQVTQAQSIQTLQVPLMQLQSVLRPLAFNLQVTQAPLM